MKTTIDRIEAGKVLPPGELARLGIAPQRVVRVVVETLDEKDDDDFAAMDDDELMAVVDAEIAAYRAEKKKASPASQ